MSFLAGSRKDVHSAGNFVYITLAFPPPPFLFDRKPLFRGFVERKIVNAIMALTFWHRSFTFKF
jgi:hypothetical protein